MGFARVYTMATPYAATELDDIDYEQSNDVVYMAHVSYPVQKLSRYSDTSWTIHDVGFGTQASAPTSVTVTPNGSTGDAGYRAKTYNYVVTTINATTGQESLASGNASATNDLSINGHANLVSWSPVAGAERYRVYRQEAGVYGYIGGTAGTTIDDFNIGPDTGDTPPLGRTPVSSPNNYPGVVTLHQQRMVLARTNTRPSAVWTSRAADLENLDTSFPLKAADALTFAMAARQRNTIQHMVPLKSLIVLTSDAIFAVKGVEQGAASLDISPQSYRGASKVRPVTVDDVIFFTTAKGNAIRTLGYTFEVDGFKGNDVTVYAPHFFRNHGIVDMAWCEHPSAVLWCVRDDGALLALTWQAEQSVWGWSLCQIAGGAVESVASVARDGEDVLYMVVRRTVGGDVHRYVERLAPSGWSDHTNAVFLDSALSYSGTPASALTGFDHMENEVLTALADGFVIDGLRVTNGVVTLPQAFSTVIVGLPYTSLMETLPLGLAQTEGKRRQIGAVNVWVVDSAGMVGGATAGQMYEIRDDSALPGSIGAPELQSGFLQLDSDAGWDELVTVTVQTSAPLPLQVIDIAVDLKPGG